ncbi:MAG: hypothetical protein LBJ11_00355 [Oscillospiraceae bacterium]|jgi:uroporphyrinogen decarboxylase|nr:hypothetical protein [Oscillospiraceae bacterium]
MTNRDRALAVLRYQPYDHLPLVHFGFWNETLDKWAEEGHITEEEARRWGDGNAFDRSIAGKLGFDFNWSAGTGLHVGLRPGFPREIIRDLGGGARHVRNGNGVVELERDGATSIPQEISHLLVDRASWEEHYLPRLQFHPDRVPREAIARLLERYGRTGWADEPAPVGLYIGSLYGCIRDWVGVVGLSYLQADDEDLYAEIIDTVGHLCCRTLEETLALCQPCGRPAGLFDYAHMWEDICFRSGPLVIPRVFADLVGPHYKRLTDLLRRQGTDLVSLDCDGCIDALVPIWLENGVNTMFPIEVGVWDGGIAPWREAYGKALRGVGGMDKNVFSRDFAAVDAEVERLRPLVALGGYLPCPDHRIAPDAKWENVCYYTRRMREEF